MTQLDQARYETVIGLEVHVQLNTATKIFCSCKTGFGAEANTQACPVCLGMPGVLPVLNREALTKAVAAGLALNGTIAHYSKFDRKNYFYPDLPKAYQISQFDKPISSGGWVTINVGGQEKKIGITRLHMEEDAGKSIHADSPARKVSCVDLNRTGVPLAEIVSEPDMRSADEAYEYLHNLKNIMKFIRVSDVNMEEGSLRCDVNISLRPWGQSKLGEKVEIKNLNSFRAVKLAIAYEIERQSALLDEKQTIAQETRLWDADRGLTFSMRSKEDAHDYRYFPDPDLPPVILTQEEIEAIRNDLPELPEAKRRRFVSGYGIPEYDAGVLTSTRELADYYEKTVAAGAEAKRASNFIMGDLLGKIDDPEKIDEFPVTADNLGGLLKLVEEGTISGKIAKTVFGEMIETGRNHAVIIREKNLTQVSDTNALEGIIDTVIAQNPQSIEDYRNGKEKALGFLVGQIMKASRGTANPQLVNEILAKKLAR